MKKLISSGSRFEQEVAYSRAVVVDNMVFVSGCTGYNYTTMAISENVLEQAEQTFKNIEHALSQAGATLNDVVRVTYILPDRNDFEICHPTFRKYFENIRPAATALFATLVSDAVKIEIEVTAVIQK
jgi:enamine deaminase RidA (YjgF/YER057c/UK114 family)